MNSTKLLDVNVCIALLWEPHSASERARLWFYADDYNELLICRLSQLAILRLLTTQALMGDDTLTMAQAWKVLDEFCADPRVGFVGEPQGLEAAFRRHSNLASKSPKVWADAYLLAFAETAGYELITFDQALKGRIQHVRIL